MKRFHNNRGSEKGLRKIDVISLLRVFVFIVTSFLITLGIYIYSSSDIDIDIDINNDGQQQQQQQQHDIGGNLVPKNSCTSEERETIKSQLLPNKCNNKYATYMQRCSLTQATKCPKPEWITTHYEMRNQHHHHNKEDVGHVLQQQQQQQQKSSPFVAIYVGCNKGFDAVNALRMGTGNNEYNKKDWGREMGVIGGSVCGQDAIDFPLDSSRSLTGSISDGIVHCIEPLPASAQRLKSSAKKLGWDKHLIVTDAAISKENGETYFLKSDVVGAENIGIDNCIRLKERNQKIFEKECFKVNVYTLDYFMETVAIEKTKQHQKDGIIQFLSIDVEGYDFDVLLGSARTLARTEYLEFEYNWMGSWADQNLSDATNMLSSLGFVCYWAGENRLWRLDESCWFDHYNHHVWSNVACVNEKLNKNVAQSMETIFRRTLSEKNVSYGA